MKSLDERKHSDEYEDVIDENGDKIVSTKQTIGVIDLLRMFRPVNPSYYLFMKNKTEIASIKRLKEQYGEQELMGLINVLPEIIKQPYAPRITSPYQLETQMGKLKAFFEQTKGQRKKTILGL